MNVMLGQFGCMGYHQVDNDMHILFIAHHDQYLKF